MKTCMIKNCREEAHEEGLCAKHYLEILKKVNKGEAEEADAEPAGSKGTNGSPETAQFVMHSALAYAGKITGSLVSSFNKAFSLTKSETADIYRQMAHRLVDKGNSKKALPVLKKVADLNPTDAEAQYQLGAAYLALQDQEKALGCLEKAAELAPENAGYQLALGIAYSREDRGDESAERLKKAAELDPENPETHYRLGVLFDEGEQYDGAIEAFERAIELNPKQADYHHHLGFTYESLDRHKEALVCYKRAFSLKKSA